MVGRAYSEVAETRASEWRVDNQDEARLAVTDEMVNDFGIFGPADGVY